MKELIKNKLYLVRKQLYKINEERNASFTIRNADTSNTIFSIDYKMTEKAKKEALKKVIAILKKFER